MAYHLDDTELYFFNEGISTAAYRALGCHRVENARGENVWRFAVWAPNARAVSVVGSFNGWNPSADPMKRVGTTGVWEAHLGLPRRGDLYKYAIYTQSGELLAKTDPFGMQSESGGTASCVSDLPSFPWTDEAFLREQTCKKREPVSIYEVHLGSWRKGKGYRELAHELVDYVADMGFTHIELMPVMAYPFDPSWGYQVTGYYCPTSRYGDPADLMYFINRAHERGLSVLLDWVPAHFPKDAHGLRQFDGTPLFEHADPRRAEMPQWGTLLFDFDCTQVQSFLLSNALFWLNEYHFDGIRVDAVSCMLYHDFCKGPGEWLPNKYGDNRNLGAIAFLKKLTEAIRDLPNRKLMIAEESSAFPCLTRPATEGGLGFTYKWNMGWMNDTLAYMEMDSAYRRWHHEKLTFSLMYAFSEWYVLPFSHDEVVCGKRSLLSKMPGDYWQKFAQLRLLYAYQFAHPGKKLLFMGDEFAQFIEWNYDDSLDWLLLGYEKHARMQRFVHDLNALYTDTRPLYELDGSWNGFLWSVVDDNTHSILSFLRMDTDGNALLCAFNFTPEPWDDYRMGVPESGAFTEVLSSDAVCYGGTGEYENGTVTTEAVPCGEFQHRVSLRIPPYGGVYLAFTPD